MGRGLSAFLALNAPASFFFLRDEILPVMRKTALGAGSSPFRALLARFFSLVQKGRLSRKGQPCSQLFAISVGTISFPDELTSA